MVVAAGLVVAPTLTALAAPPRPSPTFTYVLGVAGRQVADRYVPLIERSAKRWKLDPVLVARVIRLESEFHPREVSSVGALGLMQVMPFHFTRHQVPRRLWLDPATNIDLGCRVLAWYLTQMRLQFASLPESALLHRALIAYNMGPKAVVSRGIYRSRYSELILTRYQSPEAAAASIAPDAVGLVAKADEASASAELEAAVAPAFELPGTSIYPDSPWVEGPDRSAELPAASGPATASVTRAR